MTNPSQERARRFVSKLMLDAAAPNTGSIESDAEAWPGSGILDSDLVERLTAEFEELEREALRIGDEINQCLQIIVTNAGNIKDDRDGPILEECDAIEAAVARAAKAVRKLAALEAKQAGARKGER